MEENVRWGVKVVGVILLLEPVALTLNLVWKPSQSVSIHTESGFMWDDSSTGLYDRALVSRGHNFFLTLLPILLVYNIFHKFKFHCLLFTYADIYMFIFISMLVCAHECSFMLSWGHTCMLR